MVCLIRRALRLHRDLDLDWEDVAFVNDLLEERDRLLAENRVLRQRLARFLQD
jgi:chaperone modulatory protein CbpM